MLDRIKFFCSIVDINVGLNVSTRLKSLGVDAMNVLTATGEKQMAERFSQYVNMNVTIEYQKSSMDRPVVYRGVMKRSVIGKGNGRWYIQIEHPEPIIGSNGKERKGTSFVPERILSMEVQTPDLGPVHLYW